MRGILLVLLAQPLVGQSATEAIGILFSRGQYDRVVLHGESLCVSSDTTDAERWSLYQIAKARFYLGQNAASDSMFEKLAPHRMNSKVLRARILLEHSLVLIEMGKYEQAGSRLDEAQGIVSESDRGMWGRLHNYRGVLYFRRSELFEAKHSFELSWKALEQTDDLKQKAFVLANLGLVAGDLGKYQEALFFHLQALKLDSLRGDRADMAAGHQNIANVLNRLNDIPGALEYYRHSLQLFREVGDSGGVATTLMNLAAVFESQERLQEAIEIQHVVLQMTMTQCDALGEAYCREHIADLHRKMGNFSSSLDQLARAVGIWQTLGRNSNVRVALLRLADIHSQLSHKDSARHYLYLGTSGLVESASFDLHWQADHVTARLAQRDGMFWQADSLYRCAEAAIHRACSEAGESGIHLYEDEQGIVFRDHIGLLLRTGRVNDAMHILRGLRMEGWGLPIPLPKTAHDSTLRLVYFLHDTTSYVIGILGPDTSMYRLPDERVIHRAAVDFMTIVQNSRASMKTIRDAGLRLYTLILGPVESAMKVARRMVIEPDGALGFIPFDAMWTGQDLVLESQPTAFSTGTAAHAAPSVSDSALFVSGERSEVGLPFVEDEKRMVLRYGTLKWFEASSKREIDSLLRGHFRIIHVAAHGVNHPERAERSHLAISSGDSELGGKWTFSEIRSRPMGGSLVILSACESAVGMNFRSAGVRSLARAFLEAGASGVLSTMWDVRDRSSSDFMQVFYHEHLACGHPVDEALRRTKTQLQQTMHPSGWAPYVYWTR